MQLLRSKQKLRVLQALAQQAQNKSCRCSQCLAKILSKDRKAVNKNLYDLARQSLILRGQLPSGHSHRLQAVITQKGWARLRFLHRLSQAIQLSS